MSKIDLSKAKIGDKFRTKDGSVVEYVDYYKFLDLYIVSSENNKPYPVTKDGRFLCERECFSDLIVQEKDRAITDKICKDVEKVVNGVAEAMPLIESTTIANLPREPLPENREENYELQRRQEVLKYADMLYVNQKDTRIAPFGYDVAIVMAESIVKSRDKYLKDGKLC